MALNRIVQNVIRYIRRKDSADEPPTGCLRAAALLAPLTAQIPLM